MKRFVNVLSMSLVIIHILSGVAIVSAGALWDSMDEDKRCTAKNLWEYLVTNGYSEVAAAGVLGNCNQESYFNPKAGCDDKGNAKDGEDYLGAFQISKDMWNNSSKNSYCWWITNILKKDWSSCWSDLITQIQFVEYSCTGGYRDWSYHVEEDMKDYSSFKAYTVTGDIEPGDIESAIKRATAVFCAGFEGCITTKPTSDSEDISEIMATGVDPNDYNGRKWQQLGKRKRFAVDIYNVLKGTVALSGGTSGEVSGKATVDALVNSWLKDEYNEDWGIYEHITTELIPLPDGSGLGANEKAQLQVWKEILETEDEFSVISFLRACVAFVGILLVIYATLVYLAYWVDRVNNFVAFSCLNALTMGRLMISPDDNSSTFTPSNKNVKAVVHRDIVFVSLLGIAIGVILLSGRIYLIIDFFIEFAKDVLG